MYILIMPENTTEQQYLEMAHQFREMMEEKNELIKKIKKALMVTYSLIRTADENHDLEMVVQARQSASEFIDEFFFPDDD
jgi:putative methionine-R-sulfoxide reductase with GAF domain